MTLKAVLKIFPLTFFCYLMGPSDPITAQSAPQNSDSTAFNVQLKSIVVSAWGEKRPLLQTPSAMSVIEAVDLERDQQLHISSTLNRVPGIFMQSSNLNTNRLTIRGIGSRNLYGTSKIKAYWNEIPLSTAEVSTQLEDLDLSALSNIEIIKGPASSLYGAGLGGTILFKSNPSSRVENTTLSQQNTVGSFGLLRSVSQLQHSSKKMDVYLNLNQNNWSGYRENNDYRRNSMNLFSSYNISKKQKLSISGTFIQLKAYIPSSIDRDTYLNAPRSAATNWLNAEGNEDYQRSLIGISYSYQFSEENSLISSVFGSLFRNDEVRPFNTLVEDQKSIGVRSVFQMNRSLINKPLKLYAGTEVFSEQYDWQTLAVNSQNVLTDQNELRSYANLFVQAVYTWSEKLTIEAGLNQNFTNYNRSRSSDNSAQEYRFDQIFSPRLAVNYRVNNLLSLYANLSHGFSPPTVQETLDPEGQINPNIRPEEGWNIEIGSRAALFSGRLFYDISLYRMMVNDLLVARRTAEDQFIGLNAGSSLHQGVELSLQYQISQPLSALSINSFFNSEFNAHRFNEFIDGDQDYSNNTLTGVPDRVINAGIDFSHRNGLYGNLNWQYVGRMPMRDDNSLYSEAYSLLNMKLGFEKELFDRLRFNLESGIMNVLDQKYASQILINAMAFGNAQPRYYYPGLPRNTYLSIKLNYMW